jgi:hypothetical protein
MFKLETDPIKTITSGKKPLVPGKPTLARDITIKKNENNGIAANNPEKAAIDLV